MRGIRDKFPEVTNEGNLKLSKCELEIVIPISTQGIFSENLDFDKILTIKNFRCYSSWG